ncbi:hypothetical protein QVD17_10206 [Tagetes erecta]|uniref:Uncharacterized protein n=1 Tax=Tagetes erecta TaxID=13708 RepID=A0AAD8L634_TARER|nr:hypothetical protein QVD17_10206 [Tagetes erecta]
MRNPFSKEALAPVVNKRLQIKRHFEEKVCQKRHSETCTPSLELLCGNAETKSPVLSEARIEAAYMIRKALGHIFGYQYLTGWFETMCAKHSGMGPNVLIAAMSSMIGIYKNVQPEYLAKRITNMFFQFIANAIHAILPRQGHEKMSFDDAKEALNLLLHFISSRPVNL